MDIIKILENKSIIILGFGREGQSSYRFLRNKFPQKHLTIADGNSNFDILPFKNDTNISFVLGKNYLETIGNFDIIIKTPGISFKNIKVPENCIVTSQTDIFMNLFGKQTIGITGTKGKSTTTTLIYHILKQSNKNTLLAGNIGIPLLDIASDVNAETTIVCELSSHQLEYLTAAPHIAILLNIHQEHLDHYVDYKAYQLAKYNIALQQTDNDYFINNFDDVEVLNLINQQKPKSKLIQFSEKNIANNCCYLTNNEFQFYKDNKPEIVCKLSDNLPLKGFHNSMNMMAAILAAKLKNIANCDIEKGLQTYKPLPHRLEFVCTKNGINFYNDSISTIPEATIEALKTLKTVETLILGGFDRGIDYTVLIDFLIKNPVTTIIFNGNAGKRILDIFTQKGIPSKTNCFFENDYTQIVKISFKHTETGKTCLLSPAAASYDQFINFEERGDRFKVLVGSF